MLTHTIHVQDRIDSGFQAAFPGNLADVPARH